MICMYDFRYDVWYMMYDTWITLHFTSHIWYLIFDMSFFLSDILYLKYGVCRMAIGVMYKHNVCGSPWCWTTSTSLLVSLQSFARRFAPIFRELWTRLTCRRGGQRHLIGRRMWAGKRFDRNKFFFLFASYLFQAFYIDWFVFFFFFLGSCFWYV